MDSPKLCKALDDPAFFSKYENTDGPKKIGDPCDEDEHISQHIKRSRDNKQRCPDTMQPQSIAGSMKFFMLFTHPRQKNLVFTHGIGDPCRSHSISVDGPEG